MGKVGSLDQEPLIFDFRGGISPVRPLRGSRETASQRLFGREKMTNSTPFPGKGMSLRIHDDAQDDFDLNSSRLSFWSC